MHTTEYHNLFAYPITFTYYDIHCQFCRLNFESAMSQLLNMMDGLTLRSKFLSKYTVSRRAPGAERI